MCISIPGPFTNSGPKTPLGRFVRSHPASLGIGAAALIIVIGVTGMLLPPSPTPYWPLSVLLQGIGALLLVGILARVPARCGGEGLGYPGHWLLAVGLSGGGMIATLGAIITSDWFIGIGLFAMSITLAAGSRNLRWQLLWCHQRPGTILDLAPLATMSGAIASVIAGLTAWYATRPATIFAALIALCAWLILALGLHAATRPPVLG